MNYLFEPILEIQRNFHYDVAIVSALTVLFGLLHIMLYAGLFSVLWSNISSFHSILIPCSKKSKKKLKEKFLKLLRRLLLKNCRSCRPSWIDV